MKNTTSRQRNNPSRRLREVVKMKKKWAKKLFLVVNKERIKDFETLLLLAFAVLLRG
ncbi:MAG TPA: hypothetical protein VF411_11705 [Bacteroidia bacterium]